MPGLLADVEVEAILTAPKEVGGHIRWRREDTRKGARWKFEARVFVVDGPQVLHLRGNVGSRSYGFSLLYGSTVVRRFDMSTSSHLNPDGTRIEGPHKHRWTEKYGDRIAYVPNDIDWSDPNEALWGFLSECQIKFVGTYQGLIRF